MTKRITNSKHTAFGTEYYTEKPTRILTESGEYICGTILVSFDPQSRRYIVRLNTARTVNPNGSTKEGRDEYVLFNKVTKNDAMDILSHTTEEEAAPGIAIALRYAVMSRKMKDVFARYML